MSISVYLPELGESVAEGTITRILTKVGDTVSTDDILVEVATDKIDTDIPSPVSGVVEEILVSEDDVVPVGGLLLRVGDSSASPATTETPTNDASEAKAKDDTAPASTGSSAAPETAMEKTIQFPRIPQGSPDFSTTPGISSLSSEEKSTPDEDTDSSSSSATSSAQPEQLEDKQDAQDKKDKEGEQKDQADKEDTPQPERTTDPTRGGSDHTYVSPLVRKVAHAHNVDLSTVTGSGVGGRIRKDDVLAVVARRNTENTKEKAQQSAPSSPTTFATVGFSCARALMGGEVSAPLLGALTSSFSTGSATERNTRQLRGTAQHASARQQSAARSALNATHHTATLSMTAEADITALASSIAHSSTEDDTHAAALFATVITAATKALLQHPEINASYNAQQQRLVYHEHADVAVGCDTPQGLLTPILRKASNLPAEKLTSAVLDLTKKAHNGDLSPTELQGGTFTVLPAPHADVLCATAIVTPPQAATLSVGSAHYRPSVVVEATGPVVVPRLMVNLTLSYDAAVIDASAGGRYLHTLVSLLENPSDLQSETSSDGNQ